MKKKLLAVMLIVVMVLASAVTAFGQTEATGMGGDGTLTVKKVAKGESYSLYKLFDAEYSDDYAVSGSTQTGSIIYKLPEGVSAVPAGLSDVFELNDVGNVVLKAGKTQLEISNAVKAYLAGNPKPAAVKTVESDGSDLVFTGLTHGYYVVTSSQGAEEGSSVGVGLVSIDTTTPNGEVVDKNESEPSIEKYANGKKEDGVSIGDTVTYTYEAPTANYITDTNDSETTKVVQYVIEDTLPSFLTEVTVTSIKVDDKTLPVQQFVAKEGFSNKAITLNWTEDGTADTDHLYKNGAIIRVTYTAKVTSEAAIAAWNTNTVTLHPMEDTPDGPKPFEKEYESDAKIETYAIKVKKVDDAGNALAGAKFQVKGLTVESTGAAGQYVCTAYDPNSTAFGTEMETDENGIILIVGIKENVELEFKESAAPEGYNIAKDTEKETVTKISSEVTSTKTKIYYDAEGNVVNEETKTFVDVKTYATPEDAAIATVTVVNRKGTELPGTGGIGTTILYTIGGILVVGAGVLLVARRKMER